MTEANEEDLLQAATEQARQRLANLEVMVQGIRDDLYGAKKEVSQMETRLKILVAENRYLTDILSALYESIPEVRELLGSPPARGAEADPRISPQTK